MSFRTSPDAEVVARVEGSVGRLTLNRPRALHALTTGMCRIMTDALLDWANHPAVRTIVIDHAGERGFCAGGDVRAAAQSGAGDGRGARDFFLTEYRLNLLMFGYAKPICAVMDGVVMGGGVGISAPARMRLATDRTLWAMPEMTIGLFPDVGAGWHLSRLPGETGAWLALTGSRLKAADCLALGLATHYASSDALQAVKARLLEGVEPGAVEPRIGDPGPTMISLHRADIDRLFAGETVESILAALEADGSVWALAQKDILLSRSPTSLKVALRLLRQGRRVRNFAEEMAVEYRLAVRLAASHDFVEGVRALLVDKDNAPRWRPARLEDVSDAAIDALFAPLPGGAEFSPL